MNQDYTEEKFCDKIMKGDINSQLEMVGFYYYALWHNNKKVHENGHFPSSSSV